MELLKPELDAKKIELESLLSSSSVHIVEANTQRSILSSCSSNATIRRPHRSVHDLRSIRAQEHNDLSDFVDVADFFLAHARIWWEKRLVSFEKSKEHIFHIANLHLRCMSVMPSMLTPSVCRVLPMFVAMAPAATTLQRIPLGP